MPWMDSSVSRNSSTGAMRLDDEDEDDDELTGTIRFDSGVLLSSTRLPATLACCRAFRAEEDDGWWYSLRHRSRDSAVRRACKTDISLLSRLVILRLVIAVAGVAVVVVVVAVDAVVVPSVEATVAVTVTDGKRDSSDQARGLRSPARGL
uniref:Uncharacterized protein n=1 Tax=Anopheles coluzzii TaxID=1518534 RepID=A0A8W7PYU2_ANOCL